jgi:ankyrin repeat protein
MVTKHPRKHPRPGVDEHGRTSLHYAASQGSAKKCADLLAGGANPNASDDSGWTPLHFAAQAQSAEVASLLLNEHAPLESHDEFPW